MVFTFVALNLAFVEAVLTGGFRLFEAVERDLTGLFVVFEVEALGAAFFVDCRVFGGEVLGLRVEVEATGGIAGISAGKDGGEGKGEAVGECVGTEGK